MDGQIYTPRILLAKGNQEVDHRLKDLLLACHQLTFFGGSEIFYSLLRCACVEAAFKTAWRANEDDRQLS